MTTQTTEKTEAGNNFISNYPPFSFWSDNNIHQAHEALEQPGQPDVPLGLYIHIPFCRKRCHFCYFRVYTGVNSTEVTTNLDALIHELELYAKKPFAQNRTLDFVYFGGGTPSFLSVKQLHSLTDRIKKLMPWDNAREVAFECEPGTLTEAKLQAIREIGVTRLSLGIENFDDKILELNGRAHRSKEVFQAYNHALAQGFDQINIDLIAGMVGETEQNWQRCVDQTLDLAPDSITIYQLEVPYNTTLYKQMKEQDRSVADWPTKRRWVDDAFKQLEQQGYTIASAYTAVKDSNNTAFAYRDQLWHGADMLALGIASFSHINGVHFQNEPHMDPYLARLQNNEPPITRTLKPTGEELMIREFILQLKLGQLPKDYFQKKFKVDVQIRFNEPVQRLQDQGYLTHDETHIRLTRKGLLQIDGLLPNFFLPQHA
jgi:oxygen-independent coproporphyrinogen-3 oxidase